MILSSERFGFSSIRRLAAPSEITRRSIRREELSKDGRSAPGADDGQEAALGREDLAGELADRVRLDPSERLDLGLDGRRPAKDLDVAPGERGVKVRSFQAVPAPGEVVPHAIHFIDRRFTPKLGKLGQDGRDGG